MWVWNRLERAQGDEARTSQFVRGGMRPSIPIPARGDETDIPGLRGGMRPRH